VLTGNGNAGKAQLEGAVRRALGAAEVIRPDHASDALGLALVGLYRFGGSSGSTDSMAVAGNGRRKPDRSR
jgi:crossover junction endodeoxyribonuclease RuvC